MGRVVNIREMRMGTTAVLNVLLTEPMVFDSFMERQILNYPPLIEYDFQNSVGKLNSSNILETPTMRS